VFGRLPYVWTTAREAINRLLQTGLFLNLDDHVFSCKRPRIVIKKDGFFAKFIAMNVFVNLLSSKNQGFVELTVWGPGCEIDCG